MAQHPPLALPSISCLSRKGWDWVGMFSVIQGRAGGELASVHVSSVLMYDSLLSASHFISQLV